MMKIKILLAAILVAFIGSSTSARCQDTTTSTNGLTLLIAKVRADLKAGKRTEADLGDDLKQFDELLAAQDGHKTDFAANIILMKGMIYSEVFDDPEKAKTFFLEIKKNYPATTIAAKLDPLLTMMDRQAESKKRQAELAVNTPFPDFAEKDLDGQLLSVASFKGKVVMIDFWATWCGPCRAELPNVIATYAKYHDQGFEIIGISLDQEKDKLLAFIKENNMTWPQYFDGQRWQNKLATKYGIESIPATILIDAQGKITARDLRGEELTQAVAKALGK